MTKPIGSRSNQLPSNDQLGRFAFLNDLPPDVLKGLQDLAWLFTANAQVQSGPTMAGSLALANQQYVQNVANGAVPITLVDGAITVASAEALAQRTLILMGNLTKGATLTIPEQGQWFVINRCTGAPVLLQGANGQLTQSLIPGENVAIYVDTTGVSLLSAPLGSWLTNGQGRLLNIRSYLSAGTYKYTPSTGTRLILVYGAGAGAASAGLPACALGYAAVAQAGSVGSKAFASYTSGFNGAIITVGAGAPSVAANDVGQNGLDGGTSSFGTLLTLPGGRGGVFATTNNPYGTTAYLGQGAKAPTGQGIIVSSSGLASPAAFVNPSGMFGGIERLGDGLNGYLNGLGGMGQAVASADPTPSTATMAGIDGGFLIFELT